MRAGARVRTWALLGALLAAGACGGGKGKPADGGFGGGGIGGSVGPGGSTGAGGVTGTACLDRPGELERPPNGRLPCELIPPGLRL